MMAETSAPTVLMSGATAGIGRAAAVALAGRCARLVLLARHRGRAESTAALLRDAGAPSVETVLCDLSLMSSVRAAAAEIHRDHQSVDVLINDAAVFLDRRVLTAEGHETMFATNHLGPFLLTNLVTDLLVGAAPSRVIAVTAPSTIAPDPEDLDSSKRFRAVTTFGRTKAAELMFTYALDRRLGDRGVRSYAYHPGVTRTSLMHDAPIPMRVLGTVLSLTARTPEHAAQGLADLALSRGFEHMTGQLIHDGRSMKAPFINDVAAQEALWEAASQAAEHTDAGARSDPHR